MNKEMQNTDGTFDRAPVGQQMAAIDAAMRKYFGAPDWTRARAKEFPGLGYQYPNKREAVDPTKVREASDGGNRYDA